ncbi:hypothetical protein [Pistricoccus aurantiacus]|uniref:Uncharacterized protein n=1 Tax=Pistricoccus aurantiacus TaxID=1883414 RepID=A0A5B8SSM3_9GAMM|nr:hypothetical protein [Pistricoccus aurantiacus]QEA38485.1 hypothetical protein FGL86_04910 [Pistricoccus aurantiacus]
MSTSLLERRKSRSPLISLMVLLGLIGGGCLGWYLVAQRLHGGDAVAWFAADSSCNLHRAPCTAELGDRGRLSFSIPGDIQPLERLPLEVRVEGVEAQAVRVDFVGRGMDMGRYRFPLEETAPGVFRGEGQLSICTREVMPWRAKVLVETASGTRGSRFDFDVAGSL